MTPRLKTVAILTVATIAYLCTPTLASDPIMLEEFEAAFPAYQNHALMENFEPPCVDADGALIINANIADITTNALEDYSIAMMCQVVGYPDFTPFGPVTFSVPGMILVGLSPVVDHPDAFSVEFVAPPNTGAFTMTIENTGWPEGCIENMIDYAAWDRRSVSNDVTSWGTVKATHHDLP